MQKHCFKAASCFTCIHRIPGMVFDAGKLKRPPVFEVMKVFPEKDFCILGMTGFQGKKNNDKNDKDIEY